MKSCLVVIQGREAIPVRAIPFVTNWDLSPRPLVCLLNDTSSRWPNQGRKMRAVWLTAYAQQPVATIRPIAPREWDLVRVALDGLDSHLDASQHDARDGYARWQRHAMEIFPAGCFVWREDLEARVYDPVQKRVFWPEPDETGAAELNYSPLLSDESYAMVMAGFQDVDDVLNAGDWSPVSASRGAKRIQVLVVEAVNGLASLDVKSPQVIQWLADNKSEREVRGARSGGYEYFNGAGWDQLSTRAVGDQLKILRGRSRTFDRTNNDMATRWQRDNVEIRNIL